MRAHKFAPHKFTRLNLVWERFGRSNGQIQRARHARAQAHARANPEAGLCHLFVACLSVILSAGHPHSLSSSQSVCLSACPSSSQPVTLTACHPRSLSACLSVILSACHPHSPSSSRSVCLSVCLPSSQSVRLTWSSPRMRPKTQAAVHIMKTVKICNRTRARAHTHTHTHARTHARTDTDTDTDTHTHTHREDGKNPQPLRWRVCALTTPHACAHAHARARSRHQIGKDPKRRAGASMTIGTTLSWPSHANIKVKNIRLLNRIYECAQVIEIFIQVLYK